MGLCARCNVLAAECSARVVVCTAAGALLARARNCIILRDAIGCVGADKSRAKHTRQGGGEAAMREEKHSDTLAAVSPHRPRSFRFACAAPDNSPRRVRICTRGRSRCAVAHAHEAGACPSEPSDVRPPLSHASCVAPVFVCRVVLRPAGELAQRLLTRSHTDRTDRKTAAAAGTRSRSRSRRSAAQCSAVGTTIRILSICRRAHSPRTAPSV
jgi:hypothetical protein